MWQNVQIVGNVGRDPEIRYTPAGIAVCDFSVAVSKVWGKGDQRKEKTTWFKVTVWRDYAEVAAKFVKKGMRILVTGEIGATAYIDKHGEAVAKLELTCHEFKMLDRRNNSEEPPATSNEQLPESGDTNPPADDSDVPF